MGYEVTFHFHEEVSKGEYDRESLKSKKIAVGTPYEDVPLDILAGKIIAQLARRNILVVDVEIYEFTKKKLSYKEANDGILIKNKMYRFDDGPAAAELRSQECDAPASSPADASQSDIQKLLQLLTSNPALLNQLTGNPQAPSKMNAAPQLPGAPAEEPLRYEIYDPRPELLPAAKKRGIAFRIGQRYPIFRERPANPNNMQFGMMYTTVDDRGQRQTLSEYHFVPETQGLVGGDFTPEGTNHSMDRNLIWAGTSDDFEMPDLRR